MQVLVATRDFIVDYIERHAHPLNAILHLFGVPLAFCSLYSLYRGEALLAVQQVVGGYFLQYLGHRIQGNEVGEVILIKKLWDRWRSREQ